MKIYLIRHGATPGNLEKRYVGTTDESLTKEAADELKRMRRNYPVPRRVIASPLKRCLETASILYPGIEIEVEEDLRECSFGDFEYKNYLELTGNRKYQNWIDGGGTGAFPNGESREEFRERCIRAFRKTVNTLIADGCESAAFVVHGGTIMAVLEQLCTTEKSYFDWQTGNGTGFELELLPTQASSSERILRLTGTLPRAADRLHHSGIEDRYVMQKNRRLQCGYTTGSCAAAASMAAAQMLFEQHPCPEMKLKTPEGTELMLEIELPKIEEGAASCAVRKFGGDDPDATDGLLIFARAEFCKTNDAASGDFRNGIAVQESDVAEVDIEQKEEADVILAGGAGVGRVTKIGLEQPVGAAAINRVPRQMITDGVRKICRKYRYTGTLKITISVQGGEKVGKRTFNPHLGIVGGISILGTSGIVVPMSEQALIESIRIEMRQKVNAGERYLLITPGNYGADFLKEEADYQMLRPEFSMKCSNYVGETLDIAVELGVTGILFVSHIGKFSKVSGGIMNTHSAHADCRAELMASQAMRAGAREETALRILGSNTTEEAVDILMESGDLDATIRVMTERIQFYLQKHCQRALQTGVILFSSAHGYLGESENAKELKTRIAVEKKRLIQYSTEEKKQ